MTPFTVECTTCRRKLLVRSDAYLGQILPCPKCGSMVLVARPEGASSTAADVTAEAAANTPPAATPGNLDDIDQLLQGDPAQHADTVPDGISRDSREQLEPTSRRLADDAAMTMRPKSQQWMSEEARLMRRWLLIGSIASAAVVMLIVVVSLSLSNRRSAASVAREATPEEPSNRAARVGTDADVLEPDRSAVSDESLDAETPLGENADTAPEDAPSATSESDGAAVEEPTDTASGEPDAVSLDADRAAVDASEDHAAETAEVNTETAGGPGAAANVGSAAPSAINRRMGSTARSREALSEFDGLLADSPFEAVPVVENSLFDLIPSPGTPYDLGSAVPKPVPRPVNVTAQLGIRIPELDFREGQLGGFLRFVSSFTGVPITVDADGLYRLGITPHTPINLHATNEDLQKCLTDVLTPVGLEYVVDGGHILIRPAASDVPVDQQYQVFDLVGESVEEAKAFEDVLLTLVRPGTWTATGGEATLKLDRGRLHVRAVPATQWDIMVFTQRMRLARGLPLQGELPAQVPGLELRFAAALPRLAERVSVDHALPVPLINIIDEISAASGMDIWINWQALAEIGWTRESLARVQAVDQPLSETLQALLGPMELSFRVIDGSTLEITSAAAAYRTPETGFFPVAKFVDRAGPQKLLERVRAAIGDSLAVGRIAGGLRFDATSQTIVVTAPQYQLAAIARMLEMPGE